MSAEYAQTTTGTASISSHDIILDTDIGGDIDDTWALGMALNCPEIALRLVTTATADTTYRARIAAKFLHRAGRHDIPLGIGIPAPSDGPREAQKAWIADYPLADYPGKIQADGVQAMIDMIMGVAVPIKLVTIGPLTNIAEALRREPAIAPRADFVGMLGSIRRNFEGRDGAIAEWNVVQDIEAAQQVFAAGWHSMTITPLDTCGSVALKGHRHRLIVESRRIVPLLIMENYRVWDCHHGRPAGHADQESSILFDTVAVHLAYSRQFLKFEDMRLKVTDEGFTRPDPTGRPVSVALDWTDRDRYLDDLVARLCDQYPYV